MTCTDSGSYVYANFYVYKFNTLDNSFSLLCDFSNSVSSADTSLSNYSYSLSSVSTGGNIYLVNNQLYISAPIVKFDGTYGKNDDYRGVSPLFRVFDLNTLEFGSYKYNCGGMVFINGKFCFLRYLSYAYSRSARSFEISYYDSIPIYSLSAYKVPTFYTAEDKLAASDSDGDGYDDESYRAGYEVGKDYYKNQDADVEAIGSFFVYVLSAVMSFLMYLGINISFRDVSIITVVFFVLLGLLVWWLIHLKSGGD